jgi:hypothetical protein
MPVWVWLFLLLTAAFFSFRLVSSLKTGVAQAGPFRYDRRTDSLYFWFFVIIFLLGAIYSDGFLVAIIIIQLL